jgi:hypothetical protein
MEGPTSMTRPLFGLVAASLLAAACGDPEVPLPVRARVVVYEGSDPMTEAPSFSIREQVLATLEDVSALRGPYHRVVRGGELVVEGTVGEQVVGEASGQAEGASLRFATEGGVVVARDYPGLVMLSAYHQIEVILGALPRVAGWTADEEVSRRGPLEVMFEPLTSAGSGSVTGSATLKGNAGYLPGTRLFVLYRRSRDEEVPLGTDLRVLAHEFGHSLFDTALFAGNPPAFCRGSPPATCPSCRAMPSLEERLRAEYAVRGLDEGFADFISFAITGTTNPVAGAFAGRDIADRSISRSRFTFQDLGGAAGCNQGFYCLGTLFARSLRAVLLDEGTADPDPEARGALSRQAMAALSGTLARLRAREPLLPPVSPGVLTCTSQDEIAADYDGQVAGAFIDAFAAGMPEARRSILCRELVANFGPGGFPLAQRQACSGERP